jgi:type III restriction enzyme
VRCIVSVGMLTEGWDANTVTHIVGLRPFMSQLLCEQVVGRGLRRTSYDVTEDGKLTEEVVDVLPTAKAGGFWDQRLLPTKSV